MRVRTDIDDDLMREALEVTGLATKRSVVEHALRELIAQRRQQDVRQLRGRLSWEGDPGETGHERTASTVRKDQSPG